MVNNTFRVAWTAACPVLLLVLVAGFAVAQPQRVGAKSQSIRLEPVDVIHPDRSEINSGFLIEQSRTLAETPGGTPLEYDNIRAKILHYRMGLLDNFELNFGLDYAFNSADNGGASPDESGMEGMSLGGKIQWHPNVATSFDFTFNSSEDVHPFGGDDPAFSLNVPVEFPLAEGRFHGQIGGTIQSGDVLDGTGTVIGEWKEQLRGGIGYSYPANQLMDVSMEILGQTAPAESSNGSGLDFKDHLEFVLGSTIHLSPSARFQPSLGFGLLEGSPNYTVGLQVELALGRRPSRMRPREPVEPRYSTRDPVGVHRSDQQPVSLAPASSRSVPPREPSVDELIERAYQAARKKQFDRALKYYRRAAQRDPDNATVQFNLGSLYYRRGQYDRAVNHYRQAVQANPQDEGALMYLGASHYQLGNLERARYYLREAHKRAPDNPRIKSWLDRLENRS